MNRRDAFKMAAAAAAGSVAGEAVTSTPSLTTEKMIARLEKYGYMIFQAPDPNRFKTATELCMEAEEERRRSAFRLQWAIELGDRTAEELGHGFLFVIQRSPDCALKLPGYVWFASLVNFPCTTLPDRLEFQQADKDPLTAVQKAREAALGWRYETDKSITISRSGDFSGPPAGAKRIDQ